MMEFHNELKCSNMQIMMELHNELRCLNMQIMLELHNESRSGKSNKINDYQVYNTIKL